jgi:thiamine-phosphate pyrophosphorylase
LNSWKAGNARLSAFMAKKPIPKLHVLTDTILQTRYTHAELARLAIDGGADGIQYRRKTGTTRDLLRDAEATRTVCADAGVTFIVNDRLDIALAVDADGLHVGQDDLPAAVARRWLGPDKILGVSAHTPELGLQALAEGADYIGYGPIHATQSKEVGRPTTGVEQLSAFVTAVPLPVIAIGGIRAGHVPELLEAGAWGVAVISAVCGADDVSEAARRFVVALKAGQTP